MINKFSAALVFALAVGPVWGAEQTADTSAHPGAEPQKASAKHAIPANFGMVEEGIYRGARLQREEEYAYLSRVLGVKTMVNLQHYHHDDKALCAKYGIDCREFPIFLFFANDVLFDWQSFRKAFDVITEQKARSNKVYFHCAYGSDRTGTMAAALMVREAACGRQFDPETLWKSVDTTLEKHNFHGIYVFLHHAIKDWVFEFDKNKDWLCKQNPAANQSDRHASN